MRHYPKSGEGLKKRRRFSQAMWAQLLRRFNSPPTYPHLEHLREGIEDMRRRLG